MTVVSASFSSFSSFSSSSSSSSPLPSLPPLPPLPPLLVLLAKDTTSAGELAEEIDDTRSPAARRVKSLPLRGRT